MTRLNDISWGGNRDCLLVELWLRVLKSVWTVGKTNGNDENDENLNLKEKVWCDIHCYMTDT